VSRLRERSIRGFVATVVVVAATLGTHASYLWQRFGTPQWEDGRFFTHIASIHGFAEAMTRGSAWEGLYRPLSTNVYYLVGSRVFHHSLTVYHSLNVALFLANGMLAYAIARLFIGAPAAVLCAACFVSRQAASETLIYSVQMQTLLPAFFSLVAMLAWLVAIRRDYAVRPAVLAAVLVGLALLAKEASVGLSAILVLLSLVHPHKPVGGTLATRWVRRWVVVLPVGATVAWFIWSRPYLAVTGNRWWTYEGDVGSVIGNYVAYATSFWNGAVSPFVLHDPTVFLRDFPLVMFAKKSVALRALFCLPVAGLVGAIPYLALTARRDATQRRVAGAVIGFGVFLIALAPVAVMHDRLLSYYGYFGHFGLSLVVACACESLFAFGRRQMARTALGEQSPAQV
jgi:hypothetical protein